MPCNRKLGLEVGVPFLRKGQAGGSAVAGRFQAGGKGKGEPASPPGPGEEAAASPTPAEAYRKGTKGGGGWHPAREPTKVEKLQAQVLLYEGDPDVFDDDLLVLTLGKLEAARAERDEGKPTFTRLAEAQALEEEKGPPWQ